MVTIEDTLFLGGPTDHGGFERRLHDQRRGHGVTALRHSRSARWEFVISRVDDTEVEAMGSFVGKKQEPRRLGHAIEYGSGRVLAYVCGRRQDEAFVALKARWGTVWEFTV